MGWNVTLHKHSGQIRIDATGQIEGGRGPGVLRQLGGVVRNRDRVQINDTEKGVVVVLQIHPVADGPEPVPEMEGSSGLHPGEDPWALHRCSGSGDGSGGEVQASVLASALSLLSLIGSAAALSTLMS